MKLAAPVSVVARASRASTELAAKAAIVAEVSKRTAGRERGMGSPER